jgi:hypothetical protein
MGLENTIKGTFFQQLRNAFSAYTLGLSLALVPTLSCNETSENIPITQQERCVTDNDCAGDICIDGGCRVPYHDTGISKDATTKHNEDVTPHPEDSGRYEEDTGISCIDNDFDDFYSTEGCGTAVDCNDNDRNIHPGAQEICDYRDNNCNTLIDEGVMGIYFRDRDEDGFGNPNDSIESCALPNGYVENNDDCNDDEESINPMSEELCDGIDNNCDGSTDENCPCISGDTQQCGTTDVGECEYGTQTCTVNGVWGACSGAIEPTDELCDGLDNNCNGEIDEGVVQIFYRDNDHDGFGDPNNSREACEAPRGYVINNTDCDDTNARRHPGLEEVCDGIDNDCDGSTDENLMRIFYRDADGDGFGDPDNHTRACEAPRGYVANNTDCDDRNAQRNPNRRELCDGIDNNCNGRVDEGVLTTFYRDSDHDGFGNPNNRREACEAPRGYVANNTDCDDRNAQRNPGLEEQCDGIDNNCGHR